QFRQVPTMRQAVSRHVADSTQMLVLIPLVEARRKPRLDCYDQFLGCRLAGVVLIPIPHGPQDLELGFDRHLVPTPKERVARIDASKKRMTRSKQLRPQPAACSRWQ